MQLKIINNLKNLRSKRVLVRVDYNVDIKNGQIAETERIVRSLPTIKYLLAKGAKVILMSHLGRPDGKKDLKYSLKPVVKYLIKFTRKKVYFVDDCIGPKVKQAVNKLKAGEILLLENLRFYAQEEANDPKFAQKLAANADIYVNEAFSNCHRAHASMAGITRFLPAYAGLNLTDEVTNLSRALENLKKPAVAIIGGVKISTKIKVIDNLIKKYDKLIIGGALANNFFAAQNMDIGQSIIEKDFIKVAANLMKKYSRKLVLPSDTIKDKNSIVDIGPKSRANFGNLIQLAKTIIWNGPMGLFENKKFAIGTYSIAKSIAQNRQAFKVAGGGETIAAINKLKLSKKFNFISTAGGAMLEFMEGKILPGIKPLIK